MPIPLEAIPLDALGIGTVKTEDDLRDFVQQTIQDLLPPRPPITGGTGDPNGVVVGSPGNLYLNRSGGAGTTLYVKETGVNTNTGWVAK